MARDPSPLAAIAASSERPRPATLLQSLQGQYGNLALALATPPRDAAIAEQPAPAREPPTTELPAPLRDALLLPGATVELCALPGAGAATLALLCLAEALSRALSSPAGFSRAWLCAVDPARRLVAPAVAALGIPLSRLVVLAPPPAAIGRVAVRAARSGAFCGLLVDATGLSSLDDLPVPVRRLTLAAEAADATVFLLTSPEAKRTAPLPAAVRVAVAADGDDVVVRFQRHKQGLRDPLLLPRPQSPAERFFAGAAAGSPGGA